MVINMFTDTHCHFEKQYYDNYSEIIERAINNGVNRFVACGCSKDANKEALSVSKKFDNV